MQAFGQTSLAGPLADQPPAHHRRSRQDVLPGLIAYPAIAGISAALWVAVFQGLQLLF